MQIEINSLFTFLIINFIFSLYLYYVIGKNDARISKHVDYITKSDRLRSKEIKLLNNTLILIEKSQFQLQPIIKEPK